MINDQTRRLGFYLSLVLVWAAFALNTQNQDYDAYQLIFENPGEYPEIGYQWLVASLKFLGATSHRAIQVTLGVLVSVFFLYLNRIIYYPLVLIGFYIVFPGPLDVVQIRNTFSTFFFIFAIAFFVSGNKKTSAISILCSVAFHMFGFVYAAIFLTLLIKNKRLNYLVLGFGLFAFLFAIAFAIPFLVESGYFRTIEFYVSDSFKWGSVFFWGGVIFLDVMVVRIIGASGRGMENNFHYTLYRCMWASLMFFPGLGVFYDFNRLYRAIFFISLILFSSCLDRLRGGSKYLLFGYMVARTLSLFLYYNNELDFDWIYFGL